MLQQPVVLTIFGISGDLATRKLLPALADLMELGELPRDLHIVGVSRRKLQLDDIFAGIDSASELSLDSLKKRTSLLQLDSAKQDDYTVLKAELERIEQEYIEPVTKLFYLALPPTIADPVIEAMGESGLIEKGDPHTRLLLEKPFGFDLASAQSLTQLTERYFDEHQLYRIDHYLAKETAQNITVFRMRNPLFADIWDTEHIESITVKALEKIGIEGRTDFYEQTGALRDVVQNHLLALLSLVLMKPADTTAEFHKSRLEALQSLEVPRQDEIDRVVVRGQYEGYRQETGRPHSLVETFVALNLRSLSPHWQNTSLQLITGKALDAKLTAIEVTFRRSAKHPAVNKLRFEIQPNETTCLELVAKTPGLAKAETPFALTYSYDKKDGRQPDGYERVLMDAIAGDQTNFMTSPELEMTWRLMQPLIDRWQMNEKSLVQYAQGSSVEQIIG